MKHISIKNLIPTTLKDRELSNSEIWNQNLNFETGSFYAIKASSGMGKSTLIQLLYGIRKDYQGQIFYDSTAINTKNNDQLSNSRNSEISIVFQDLRLFDQLTVQQNIELKQIKKEDHTKLSRWAEELGVLALWNQTCQTLSYGEKQRVAILRALAQPFDFLLLDEPFSHLDKQNALKAYALIRQISALNKATIIMTTLGNEEFIEPDKTLIL
jgi:ABC-type lipoprotein export system ATPase subunit